MTDPEIMLWSRLKGRGTDRPAFRRQVAFKTVILDFYCPAARLAVEIDGSMHWSEGQRAKDAARDGWLRSQGIEVLRIDASDVYRSLGDVEDGVIRRALERIAGR